MSGNDCLMSRDLNVEPRFMHLSADVDDALNIVNSLLILVDL